MDGLRTDNVAEVLTEAKRLMAEFFERQRDILAGLAEQAHTGIEDLQGVGESARTQDRAAQLQELRAALERLGGDGPADTDDERGAQDDDD